jgi:hypothetical protein
MWARSRCRCGLGPGADVGRSGCRFGPVVVQMCRSFVRPFAAVPHRPHPHGRHVCLFVCLFARAQSCYAFAQHLSAEPLSTADLKALGDVTLRPRPPARCEYSSTPASARPPAVSTLVPLLPPARP